MAKVLELQLHQQSFQWIFRVDFFRTDWFDLLAVQGALKGLLQHQSLKAYSTLTLLKSINKISEAKTYLRVGWVLKLELLSPLLAYQVKNLPAKSRDVRDVGFIPGSGRSPGVEMATHSSILAWRILWTEDPGGLQFIKWQRVGHDWSDLACTHTSPLLINIALEVLVSTIGQKNIAKEL